MLERLEGLPDSAWTDIGMEEEAIFATHRSGGWDRMQHYVVIRRRTRGGQFLLMPQHTVVLVSRNDLSLKELVHRHRGKQGQENAFKGPLEDMDRPAAGTVPTRHSTPLGTSPRCCCGRCSTRCCRRRPGVMASGRSSAT